MAHRDTSVSELCSELAWFVVSQDFPGEPRGRGGRSTSPRRARRRFSRRRKARQLLDWIDVGTLSRGSGTGRSPAERLLTIVTPPARGEEPRRMRNLSERQRQGLDFIRGYVRDNGVAPSRPEIDQAARGDRRAVALNLLPHVPGDGDHGVAIHRAGAGWGSSTRSRARARDTRGRRRLNSMTGRRPR